MTTLIGFSAKALLGLSLFFVLIPHVYAISSNTDKTIYALDDKIIVSGNVDIVAGKYIGLQIRSSNDLVQLDQFLPSGDGSFSKEYIAKGTKWNLQGTYTVIVAYDGQTSTSTFQFNPESAQESQNPKTETPKVQPEIVQQTKPKIPGFPELDKSPQYYFNRYQSELAFKEWFDRIFHGYTIQEIVGYKKTHIDSFPDMTKSRQHYLDRYSNEEKYRSWFDSQFPGESIYEFFEILEKKMPSWVKNSAGEWSRGEISDSDFINEIKYLVENNFIKVSVPDTHSGDKMPDWIRNNASWWSSGKITEGEFVNGIRYLIENGVITLD